MLIYIYRIGTTMSTIENIPFEENSVVQYTLSLTDILENIFSYLNFNDLRHVINTCRLWRELAKKELSLRNQFESLILPLYITPYNHGVSYNDGEDFFEYYNNIPYYRRTKEGALTEWHVSNVVRNVPKMFFLFYEAQTLMDLPFHREYLESLPKSSAFAAIGLLMLSVDTTELFGFSNLGAGISMPSTPALKSEFINIDQYSVDYLSIAELMEQTCDKLKIHTEEANSCYIIFLARVYDSVLDWYIERAKVHAENFVKHVKERCNPGTYSIFGSGCYFIDVFSANSGAEDMNYGFILRLYGQAMKSWSLVLSLDISAAEAMQRLLNFKKNIRLRSNTIAIATLPVDRERAFGCAPNDQLTADMWLCKIKIFKKAFPKVPLTCLFDDRQSAQYGCNTLDDDRDAGFQHRNSVIYLIITTT